MQYNPDLYESHGNLIARRRSPIIHNHIGYEQLSSENSCDISHGLTNLLRGSRKAFGRNVPLLP